SMHWKYAWNRTARRRVARSCLGCRRPARLLVGLLQLAIAASSAASRASDDANVLRIDNGTMLVGIDRDKGASITWISWTEYPQNCVNVHDPGRLIQQSYYSGKSLDRTSDGQSPSWSPWPWNPIQGGGVESWARVTQFSKIDAKSLESQTIPKLWDMPNEEADAVMLQSTQFESAIPRAIVVHNRLVCHRSDGDAWGPATKSPQEIPACYFTRNFDQFASYLGDGKWRPETQAPGPPWGRVNPPKKALACFNPTGQGIAVFSPTSGDNWNFGPHGTATSTDPQSGPCVHMAPIAIVTLGPKSSYAYRYWLVVGNRDQLSVALDALYAKYAGDRHNLSQVATPP
ncbi:MAG: hypothetical protein KDA61_14915, partial [Planctomycetales bacterium]|nr:hypothetical protein [Planctomycetales bacterium]